MNQNYKQYLIGSLLSDQDPNEQKVYYSKFARDHFFNVMSALLS